jgi:hypothetical protein
LSYHSLSESEKEEPCEYEQLNSVSLEATDVQTPSSLSLYSNNFSKDIAMSKSLLKEFCLKGSQGRNGLEIPKKAFSKTQCYGLINGE